MELDVTQAVDLHTQTPDLMHPKPPSPLAAAAQKSTNPFQPRVDSQYQPLSNPKPFQRHYGSKSTAELRQLAKGALLSLAPHSIHYGDLVTEGIDPRLLTFLYEELGIKVSTRQATEQPYVPATVNQPEEVSRVSAAAAPAGQLQLSASGLSTTGGLDRPAPAISPSLERKDRIAQLLAAKAGRPSPARSVSDSVGSTGPLDATQTLLPAGDAAAIGNLNTTNDSMADLQETGLILASTTQAETLKESLEQLRDDAQIQTRLERRSTDGGALPSPFSSSIPGLFMKADDRMQLEAAPATGALSSLTNGFRVASTSQKRRRSSDESAVDYEPITKRQNTTSDLDEGEVMVLESPSDDDASEGEITEDETSSMMRRRMQEASTIQGAQLQRSQSATELPTVAPRLQHSGVDILSGSTPASQSKLFGGTAVTGMTSAQITERAEMLKARFLKQRAERQKALQDGLPNLNAEVKKTQALLAQKKAALLQFDEQIQNLTVELANAEQQKQMSAEEISRLERQLQEGISGQRQYNDELQKLSTDQNASTAASHPKATRNLPETAGTASLTMAAAEASDRTLVESAANPSARDDEADMGRVTEEVEQGQAMPSTNHNSRQDSLDRDPAVSDSAILAIENEDNSPYQETVDVDDDNFQDSAEAGEVGEVGDEVMTESRSDFRNGLKFPADSHLQDGVRQFEVIAEDDSDGSASMSDSGSEIEEGEYEPADPDTTYPMDVDNNPSDEYDPEEAPVEPTPPIAQTDEPEDYEPAEIIAVEHASVHAYDAALQEVRDTQVPGPSNEYEPPLIPSSTSTPQINGPGHALYSESSYPNPFQQRPASTPSIVRPLSNPGAGHKVEFAPYQSPLSNYKSFRYNQQFNESAKEGFRSLTYSNTIDPNVPLCQTELTGGVCQDLKCEEQHFRKFQLSGM